jgi:predicted Zn-dependent protease
MVSVGYDPNGMVQTMAVLEKASGKGGGAPEFLSTHPNPGNRLEYLEAEIKKKYAAAESGKVGAEEFTRNVLARRISALPPLPADAAVWCAHCREEKAQAAKRVAHADPHYTATLSP